MALNVRKVDGRNWGAGEQDLIMITHDENNDDEEFRKKMAELQKTDWFVWRALTIPSNSKYEHTILLYKP